jgi:copper chaperone NosL
MAKSTRILILIAAVLLLTTFVAPLWEISIVAPQYPEGLAMQIWTTKITGDVRNINILNHYIGMKFIKESDFQELVWFSKFFAVFSSIGLLIAALKQRFLGNLWSLGLIGFATWAFYDFWKWEYTFGHTLSEDAPIKVEGMSYAPPLIGSKELLNITASSWPALGGIAVALAVFLAAAALFLELKEAKKMRLSKAVAGSAKAFAVISSLLLFSGCFSAKAEPMLFGKDSCHHCQMTIVDRRFGAEWVSDKGKAYKFDSLECLAGFLEKKGAEVGKGSVYVVDAAQDGKLVPAERASFILREDLRSPMGKGYFAAEDSKQLRALSGSAKLPIVKWREILAALSRQKS